ncbi:MAG: tRNA lysidine(34) synthetase TilS [Eubacteriales bacterium]
MHAQEHPACRGFMRAMREEPISAVLADAQTVFVGYSGGADSGALLVLTAEYCRMTGKKVHAVHVHHGIRGEEADRDAAFCRDFCAERAIPFTLRRADVPAYAAAHRLGLEDAARRLRYAAFAELTAEPGTVCVTAHSADDNLETVLFHMMRGTGLDGLCGIPPVRGRILRPLLSVSASDIRDFCRTEHIPFVVDSTNTDTAYTRNYIRTEIVPALRRVTPSPEEAVRRMSRLLREDAAYLRQAAAQALGAYADKCCAPLSALAELPEPLCARACALLYRNAGGENLCAVHLEEVCGLVRRGAAARLCLPGDICARIFDGMLEFLPRAVCESAPPADFTCELGFGERLFPDFGFGVSVKRENPPNLPSDKNIYKLSICKSFPFATIQGKIILRFRQPGDTIRSGGMTRSVRKLLSAARLPPEKRAFLPVLCDSAGILWIPGVCARDCAESGPRVHISYFTV